MTETEVKWELDQSSWLKLKQVLPLDKQLNQKNTFFDSPDLKMRYAHWALRWRLENETSFLTAKGPATLQGKMVSRPELEIEIDSKGVDALLSAKSLSQLDFEPCVMLREKFGDLELNPFLSFENQREVLIWENEKLELDKSTCCEEVRYELEWEGAPDIIERKLPSFENWLKENDLNFNSSKMGKMSWAWGVFERKKSRIK